MKDPRKDSAARSSLWGHRSLLVPKFCAKLVPVLTYVPFKKPVSVLRSVDPCIQFSSLSFYLSIGRGRAHRRKGGAGRVGGA